MAIIARTGSFSAAATNLITDLESTLNTIFNDYNGNITDANISGTAAIAQSKIASLIADLGARLLDTGDTILGELKAKYASPGLRLTGTEASAKDWKLIESAGDIIVQENTGTESVPVWVTRYTFKAGADITSANGDVVRKLYVDDLTKNNAFGKVEKSDGDITYTSQTTAIDITGLTVTLTTRARRVRLAFSGSVNHNFTAGRAILLLLVDGVEKHRLTFNSATSDGELNASFSYVTDVLTAASHTFKMQLQHSTAGGTSIFRANAIQKAVFVAEELVI